MGVAYSQDLRDRVLAAVDGGLRVYSAAPLFRVSVSYIYKALGRRRSTGDVTAHKSGGGPKPKLAAYDEALRAQVAQTGDITLIELQAWLANHHAVKVSVGCLWARVRHLGLTLKKSRSAPPSRTAPTSRKLASNGGRGRANGERTIWCLSTKPGHRPK
jgi:transposase